MGDCGTLAVPVAAKKAARIRGGLDIKVETATAIV
jgi:hypothetical protein